MTRFRHLLFAGLSRLEDRHQGLNQPRPSTIEMEPISLFPGVISVCCDLHLYQRLSRSIQLSSWYRECRCVHFCRMCAAGERVDLNMKGCDDPTTFQIHISSMAYIAHQPDAQKVGAMREGIKNQEVNCQQALSTLYTEVRRIELRCCYPVLRYEFARDHERKPSSYTTRKDKKMQSGPLKQSNLAVKLPSDAAFPIILVTNSQTRSPRKRGRDFVSV